MQISEAVAMIRDVNIDPSRPVVWADLGCGTGTFTKALAEILPAGSMIHAIDKSHQTIPGSGTRNININFIRADFEKGDLSLPALDGVLMGNSLHYVADKNIFFKNLVRQQPSIKTFIIIEYDIVRPNTWVPYPVRFDSLQDLFTKIGFTEIVRLAERRSLFQRGNIYSCLAKKP